MSVNTLLQKDDIGITFIVTVVQQDGRTAQDISSATSMTIYLMKPDAGIIAGTAMFFTDGTDGKMVYTSQDGDLGEVGIYQIQGSYSVGGNIFYTNKSQFTVSSNI